MFLGNSIWLSRKDCKVQDALAIIKEPKPMSRSPSCLVVCLRPPSVEEVRPGSHESSDVASPLRLGFEKCDVDGTISLSLESVRHVVPIDDGVPKSGPLSAVPRAIVAREVCDCLATLAIAYCGSAVG
jgi:hypothetical protein